MGSYKDEHGTTRVGDFLRTAGPVGETILDAAAGLTGQAWLSKVGDMIGGNSELKQTEREYALQLVKLDLEDMRSAREMNVKIQETANAGWMSKNLPYIFDCFIIGMWGFMTVYIVMRWLGFLKTSPGQVDMTGILGIYSGVTALATMIIQFHRGSSAGSKEKTQLMSK